MRAELRAVRKPRKCLHRAQYTCGNTRSQAHTALLMHLLLLYIAFSSDCGTLFHVAVSFANTKPYSSGTFLCDFRPGFDLHVSVFSPANRVVFTLLQ